MTGQMVKLPEDEDTPEKVRSDPEPFCRVMHLTISIAARGQDLPHDGQRQERGA